MSDNNLPPKQMSEETRQRLAELESNYAEALLIRERGYAVATVIGTVFVGITAIGFVAFLLAAAWFEKKPSIDTMLWGSIMGLWTLIITTLFGASKSKGVKAKIDEMAKAIRNKDKD